MPGDGVHDAHAPAAEPTPHLRGQREREQQPGWLRRLIEPGPSVQRPSDRRRARIAAAAALTIATVGCLGSLLGPLALGSTPLDTPRSLHGLIGSLLAIPAYAAARTRHWRAGAFALVLSSLYSTWASILLASTAADAVTSAFFLITPILVAGVLLTGPIAAGIAAVSIALLMTRPGPLQTEAAASMVVLPIFLTLLTALILAFSRIWNGDLREIQRRHEDASADAQYLHALLEHAPDTVVVVDDKDRIRYVNRVPSGMSMDDAIGQRPDAFANSPGEQAQVRRSIRKARATGEAQSHEVHGPGPDGSTSRWLTRVIPLDGAPTPKGNLLLIAEDVTEARRAEEAKRAHEAQRHEIERLSEIASWKSRFLNAAAHELNTPMTPLIISTRMLRHNLDDPETSARQLSVVERNVARIRDLLAGVLDAARMGSDRLALTPDRTDLRTITRDVIASYQPVAEDRGITLDHDIDPDPVTAIVDTRRTEDVVGNLVDNALKFTPEGGTVTITCRTQDEHATIRVSDTGRGLSAEQRQRLFQPFERVHDDTAAGPPGSGLGLFICQGLVERQSGVLTAHSDGPGKGSTFTLRFPRMANAEPGGATHPNDPGSPEHAPTPHPAPVPRGDAAPDQAPTGGPASTARPTSDRPL